MKYNLKHLKGLRSFGPIVLITAIVVVTTGFSFLSEADEEGFVSIFNGETLDGWSGNMDVWRAENGSIIGETTPSVSIKRNTFLVWQDGDVADFELKAQVRITRSGNSGIQYRSEEGGEMPYVLKGYQFDTDGQNRYTGGNYEEGKRTFLAYRGEKVAVSPYQGNPDSVRSQIVRNTWSQREITGTLEQVDDSLHRHIKSEDWNEFHLVAKGNHLQHYINGVLMSDVTDNDEINRRMSGLLGLQIHVGPPMKVEFRNIRLKQVER